MQQTIGDGSAMSPDRARRAPSPITVNPWRTRQAVRRAGAVRDEDAALGHSYWSARAVCALR